LWEIGKWGHQWGTSLRSARPWLEALGVGATRLGWVPPGATRAPYPVVIKHKESQVSIDSSQAMRIAVVGAGNIGRTLGDKWIAAGHQVVYGVRRPGEPGTAAVADAVAGAEVVVLAVPGAAAKDVVASLGGDLVGKVVIDATNDVQGEGRLHALGELVEGAHPVRAFNTLGWESFADPVVGGVRADLLYAAEEGVARDTAERLIRDVGLEPVWLGGVDAFDVVDSVTRLWFTLVFQRKLGRRLAFKVLRET
jgi:predicted dinucleotide-binding enzyme